MHTTATHRLLREARLSDSDLALTVAVALGRPVELRSWDVERVPYDFGSPATGALLRVRGSTTDGQPWSLFVKVLQHPRHWRFLDRTPTHVRQEFLDSFPWRGELAAWEPAFVDALPVGLRVPRLHRVVELVDDRVALWMEDVVVTDQPWTLSRFHHAARLLGALAANRCDPTMIATWPIPAGFALERYVEGAVRGTQPWLADHDLWRHPVVDGSSGRRLQRDLVELSHRIPELLARLDRCPQSLPHGDASPQNLLVPRDEPGTFVAIDIAFQSPQAIGFDLSQLLIGLVHAGEMPASDLPAVHEVLGAAFAEGLDAGGVAVSSDDLRVGYVASLVLRAAFTSLPFGDLAGVTDAALSERIALTRFLVDLGMDLIDS